MLINCLCLTSRYPLRFYVLWKERPLRKKSFPIIRQPLFPVFLQSLLRCESKISFMGGKILLKANMMEHRWTNQYGIASRRSYEAQKSIYAIASILFFNWIYSNEAMINEYFSTRRPVLKILTERCLAAEQLTCANLIGYSSILADMGSYV